MPTDVASRRRLNAAVAALARFSTSRNLDLLHAARSGVPLSMAAVGVLGQVAERSPVGLGELRAACRLQPAALSRHVRILEEGGYLERTGDPDDGRAAVVSATSRGRRAVERWRAANDDLLAAQLVHWDVDELNRLAALMERLEGDLRSWELRSRSERGPDGPAAGARS